METTSQVHQVAKCPLCGKSHTYKLKITRSTVLFGAPDPDSRPRISVTFTCPKTGNDFKVGVPLEEPEKGTAGSVSAELAAEADDQPAILTPHERALYEAGKSLLLDSVATAREFCKSMIATSTAAIPVYLGILTFLLPKDPALGTVGGWTIALPAVGYLAAAILFTLGYLPSAHRFSLDVIAEIQQALEQNLARRTRFIWAGLAVFVLSTLYAIFAILINIGLK